MTHRTRGRHPELVRAVAQARLALLQPRRAWLMARGNRTVRPAIDERVA
jgi:hypothetical protein